MSGRHRAGGGGRHRQHTGAARAAALFAALAVTVTAVVGRAHISGGASTSPPQEPAAAEAASLTSSPPQEATLRVSEDLESTPSSRSTSSALASPPATDRVAESGSGHFMVASGRSRPTGSGELVTYSVEVEDGLPFAAPNVAREIDRVLGDRRGWTAIMSRTVQRVSTDPTFRIRLATPETTDALCAPLDTDGRLSCRNGPIVVLNAWRWANGANAYDDNLDGYRVYMVNHEFGHALGNGHVACPKDGSPAPVMVQQTKGLEGCISNPWPTAG